MWFRLYLIAIVLLSIGAMVHVSGNAGILLPGIIGVLALLIYVIKSTIMSVEE